jgi:NADPH-dependent curcumin reductase CurA
MYAQPVPAVACAASGPAGCTTQQLRKGTVPSSSSTCHVVAAVAGAEQLASQSQVEAYYRVQQYKVQQLRAAARSQWSEFC